MFNVSELLLNQEGKYARYLFPEHIKSRRFRGLSIPHPSKTQIARLRKLISIMMKAKIALFALLDIL
jgi:hypothetical protein